MAAVWERIERQGGPSASLPEPVRGSLMGNLPEKTVTASLREDPGLGGKERLPQVSINRPAGHRYYGKIRTKFPGPV